MESQANSVPHLPLIIVGAGPAGLSAAIYTSRASIPTIVLGCQPKIAGDYDIDNYFGFPETISGQALIERGIEQAKRFGTVMSCEKVLAIHSMPEGCFEVVSNVTTRTCCAVILATGVSRMRPGISNLGDYEGKGVSWCVSCDGFFYKNRPVAVLGEGIFAANQALELLTYTPDVRIITQGKPLAITPDFQDRLNAAGITVLEQKVERLEGDNALSRLVFADGQTLDADGLFVAMGEASSLDFARALGVTVQNNFVEVDARYQTNIPGVFAAGDCTGGFLQISVSVGEGAVAGKSAIDYIKANTPHLLPKRGA
ncbi:NAD(P)/FAD-dependent oxidoreductase [Megalodesulfovibrio paquesii]